MALAANSYGTVEEVEALTRHVATDSGFGASTTPTLTEVESIINRVSGVLNTALSAGGFSIPVSDATSVLACDEWVIKWTMRELRYTYPHMSFESSDDLPQGDMFESAQTFVEMWQQAFKNLGETVSDDVSSGLTFTALNKHSERTDPTNTSYEQPKFRRGLFDA